MHRSVEMDGRSEDGSGCGLAEFPRGEQVTQSGQSSGSTNCINTRPLSALFSQPKQTERHDEGLRKLRYELKNSTGENGKWRTLVPTSCCQGIRGPEADTAVTTGLLCHFRIYRRYIRGDRRLSCVPEEGF